MPANLQFKRGLLANLPHDKTDGTIYVTTDEHAMYLDYGTQRIRLGDFIPVDNITDLPSAGHAYETAMYYIKKDNILARWQAPIAATETTEAQPGRWIQINKAGVVGVQTVGTGNLISEIRTSTAPDGTLQLLVTKISVASNDDFSELAGRVTVAESTLATLTEGMEQSQSILDVAASISETLLGGETEYVTLKALGDRIRALTTIVDAIPTTIDNKVATAIAEVVANAPASFDTLKEIADWIANHPDDSAAFNTAINNLQGRMTTIEGNLTQEIADRTAADTTLQSNIDQANTRIDTVNTTVGSLTTGLSELRTMVLDHDERLTWIDFDDIDES